MSDDAIATLTIYGINGLSKAKRAKLVAFLRAQAELVRTCDIGDVFEANFLPDAPAVPPAPREGEANT